MGKNKKLSRLKDKECEYLRKELLNLENWLEKLIEKKRQLQKEIKLYEEDWTGYEEEELQEIEKQIDETSKSIEEIENYLLEHC